MVLDSEPKPSGQDIDLRIPAPDQAGDFMQGPVVPDGAAVAAGSAPLAVSAPAAASAVVNAAQPVVSHPSAQPAHVAAAQERAAAKAAPVAKKQAEHKTSTVAKKPAEHQAKASVTEGYVAQVGAYANADAARQELDKLKKWGFSAYTEKSGDKIRVRVGPFADRDKADHARLQLEKHGLHAVVMNAK
jgi:DedD protein